MEGGDRIVSSSIDQRIVSMKFDNAQFESGAKQSINTLDKLKESVDLGKSANSLKELGNAANNFSVANIEHGLSNLGRGFSVLEVAAITAISNITTSLMNKLGSAISNTLGLIYSGGLRRATNLEQARFSMQGLLYDTDEAGKQILNYGITVEDVMSTNGPVQTAVRGTAFGLDEAAKAASNFIASGVTDLGELEEVLKSISGTAAQTGGSYEEIAHIYQRIAGNNRVYAIDLQSFAARGVNAAAALAKSLGKTEVEVREMVSDGKIDLKIFSKAMYDAFGENAFRANETYSGSLSNLKAALSRLGAKFESKKLENMRDIFNALRPTVDSISSALDPLITAVTDLSTAVSQFAIGKIEKIKDFFDSLVKQSNKKFDILEDFDKLTEGMSKAEKLDFRKQIENGIYGPIGNLKSAFENVIQSIKNLRDAFSTILSPLADISKLWISVWTNGKSVTDLIALMSSKVLALTERFKNFVNTDFFKTNVLLDLKSVLYAVLNVLDTARSIVFNFAKLLKNTMGPVLYEVWFTISSIVHPLTKLISNFGEIIREGNLIGLVFSKLTDIINGVLRPLLLWYEGRFFADNGYIVSLYNLWDVVDSLSSGFANLAIKAEEWLTTETDFSSWGLAIAGALSKILDFLSPVGDGFEKLKEKVVGFFKGMSSNSEGFSIFESLTNLLEKAGNTITNIATKIWNGLGMIGEGIRNAFTGPNLTSAAGALTIFGAGGIAYKIFQFVRGFAKLRINDWKTQLQSFMGTLELVGVKLIGLFRTMTESFQIKSIKEISTAILIFAGAIFVLSMIEPSRLIAATAAITAAVVELVAAFGVLAALFTTEGSHGIGMFSMKKSTGRTGMHQLGASLIALSAAILILAIAMKTVSSITNDGLTRGIMGLTALFTFVIIYIAAIESIAGNSQSIVKGSATLIGLAIAIDLLVIAVKKLGEMDVETLMKGLTSVGLLLTGLMIFTAFSGADKMGFSSGAGILLLATVLVVLTNAVKTLGSMNTDQLTQGLGAIGFALLGLIVFVNALEGTKPISAAAGLLIAAAALVVIANALSRLTGFDAGALSTSMLMLLSTLGGIMLVLMILDKTVSVGTTVGLLLIATAVATLAEAFLVLALVPADKLATGLLAIVVGLAAIGAVSYLLEPVAATMVVLAGAITLFGVGVLALATAIAILTPIMVTFSVALIGSLEVLLNGIVTIGQQITNGMITILTAVVDAIIATAPKMKTSFIVIIQMLLEAFVELFAVIVQTVVDLLTLIATALVEAVPMLANAALQIIFGILTVIMDNVFEFVVLGMTIVTNFINGIAEALPDLIDAGFNLIISFIEGLAEAIDKNAERMGEAGWKLISSLFTGIGKAFKGFTKEPIKLIKELGTKAINKLGEFFNIKNAAEKAANIINGLKDGIGNKIYSVIEKIKDLGSRAIEKLKEFISFDKLKEMGKNIINGLIDGIGSLASTAVDKIKEIGQNLLDGFKNFLGIHSPSTKFEDTGKDIVRGVNDGMDKNKSTPLNTITSIASDLLSKFTGLFSKKEGEKAGSDYTSGIKTGLDKKSDFEAVGKKDMDGFTRGISSDAPLTAAASALVGVKSALNKDAEFETIGTNLMNGLSVGIKKGTPKVVEQSGSTANSVVRRVQNEMEVKSPSRVFMRIGEYCMEGLAVGLGETGSVEKKVSTLKDILTEGLESKIDDINTSPTITPILDLSNIQNGMTSIDNMLGRNQMLGTVSANFSGSNNLILSAIDALTNRLNQQFEDNLSSEEIYDAVRQGASNAKFTVLLDGRRITSAVNDNNSDSLDAILGFM